MLGNKFRTFARAIKMADDIDRESIREEVRACIREELHSRPGTQTLVNRTRNLVRGSASFAARSLSTSPFASRNAQPLPQAQSQSSEHSKSSDKGKRPLLLSK